MRIDQEYMEKTIEQFELDYNVKEGIWVTPKICLSPSKKLEGARMNEKGDLFFNAAIFMGKAYVMAEEALHPWIKENLCKEAPEWWCKFQVLNRLNQELNRYGREIMDTHIYFLPSEEPTMEHPRVTVQWFEREELEQFRGDQRFHKDALCFSSTQPDVLAVGASIHGELVAMAGCSEDGKNLWQIGIDVVAGHEGQGLGAHLVTLLKQEIISRGKVPFYGTSESHAVSRNIAIGSGFLPAWCEIQGREK